MKTEKYLTFPIKFANFVKRLILTHRTIPLIFSYLYMSAMIVLNYLQIQHHYYIKKIFFMFSYTP